MESTLAILGVFFVPAAMIILIVWFRNNAKTKRYQYQADLATKALEKGQPISADLFAEIEMKRNPLNTAIILIAAGIGISLFFILMSAFFLKIDTNASSSLLAVSSVGILPFFIGLAYLIIHFIEKKKAAKKDAK